MNKINFKNNSEPPINSENLNKMQDNIEDAITEITEYDLNDYKTDYINTMSRNVCKVKNGICYISSYFATASELKADTNYKLFNLPTDMLSDDLTTDFVIVTNSGIVGRGFVGTKTAYSGLYFRFSSNVPANSPVIFNLVYLL